MYASGDMELAAGRIVEGWRVEAVVGRGAMAAVHRVRHVSLGTVAALKVLDRVDPTLEQRLVQEGRAQGSLHHPGVVGVLDLLRVDDHAALLLEYVDGADLAARLARGPLPRAVALDLFRQVVRAVGAAHDAGLVHRDLKPSNVLVAETADGWIAKVGDFGLVKSDLGELTLTHALVGTPRYMAPEQMRAARDVDRRADVFALGCLLYELTVGAPPFDGHDLVELYGAKMGSRFASVPAALGPAVAAAIDGCLRGSLAHRIPDCSTLLAVLDGGRFDAPADPTFDGGDGQAVCPSCGAVGAADPCATCGSPLSLDGRFRLVAPVSAGGSTRVWRGIDLRDGRWVCVRALSRGADPATRERFDRGIRVLSELDHPQLVRPVCPPFDEHGARWEVRGWVEGASLGERLVAHRFTEAEVLEVVAGLVPVLTHLAERSPPVVHRAIEPAHVIETTDHRWVLIGFGQVRDVRADQSLHDVPSAAPEQWVGEATPASDVFGLGALAITLLARVPAHTLWEGTALAFGDRVAVRPETAALLARMVDPDPARRPPIAEVGRQVARLRSGPLRATQRDALRRFVGAAAASLGLAAIVVLALWGAAFEAVRRFAEVHAPQVPSTQRPITVDPAALPARNPDPAAIRGREVPQPDCAPFVQRVRIDGLPDGEGVPLYLDGACGAAALGSVPAGREVAVTLPFPGALRVPLAAPTCALDAPGDRSGSPSAPPCARYALSPAPASGLVAVRLRTASQPIRTVDPSGSPVADVELAIADGDWGLLADPVGRTGPDGALAVPWERPRPSSGFGATIDGVGRRIAPADDWVVVLPIEHVARVAVVDPSDAPIVGAEVRCETAGAPISVARTGPDGTASCDVAAGPATAVVRAIGRVRVTTALVDPIVRVVLEPAVPIRLGCLGMPGDRCADSDGYRCFEGRRPSGVCASVDGTVTCACAPSTTAIVHPLLGRVDRVDDRPGLWFDLRDIAGAVTVPAGCSLRLDGANGWLRTTGASLERVPPGTYRATGLCGDQMFDARIPVAAAPVTIEPALRRIPVLRTPAPQAAPEVERALVEYHPLPTPAGEARPLCEVRVTIAPDGRLARVDGRRCSQELVAVAERELQSWRWEPGAAETSETLYLPFR
ncbi:MAG: protein kinase [Myxococcota bacterium]